MLAGKLSVEGLNVQCDPPKERRGVGQELVHLVTHVATEADTDVIDASGREAVRQIAQAFRMQHPGAEADIESSEAEDGGGD